MDTISTFIYFMHFTRKSSFRNIMSDTLLTVFFFSSSRSETIVVQGTDHTGH